MLINTETTLYKLSVVSFDFCNKFTIFGNMVNICTKYDFHEI